MTAPDLSRRLNLTMDELEAIAWHFRDQGVTMQLGAEGWYVDVLIAGVETRFRAEPVELKPVPSWPSAVTA